MDFGPPAQQSYQPSQQEVDAQKAAENDKISSMQDRLRSDSDRLFRIYGARQAFSGTTATPIKRRPLPQQRHRADYPGFSETCFLPA